MVTGAGTALRKEPVPTTATGNAAVVLDEGKLDIRRAGEAKSVIGAASATISPSAAAISGGQKQQPATGEKKPLDPGMFIAPRAPDDPGVAAGEPDEGRKPAPRVVASGQR